MPAFRDWTSDCERRLAVSPGYHQGLGKVLGRELQGPKLHCFLFLLSFTGASPQVMGNKHMRLRYKLKAFRELS